ncbi:MAG: bifunctional 23S rRNA (guanine(2069)-N(7))-methyltransferase RlmK/23S rRNA (guanine(2445)-N(2))-methyltransferase RlmL [Atopobiaceae bacterium]|nr:bifunctional 23S rRNA (guanine(2069)-N(7))-methyltransferase RlmK/23S rRNA (guanine(2445)-N(2))-methyltransferase RlmL [Atopobiaceae bacterium]
MKASEQELVARCAGGFEKALAHELRGLGMRRVRPLNGSVAFFGSQRDAYRVCLWSRVATRVQLVLGRVAAADADELYQNVVSFPWERHVRDGATVAVRAHGTNEMLRNTHFVALKVKDALCDRLREVRGVRPDVDAKQPGFLLQVGLHGTRATLLLDLSGESLHRRGYRQEGVQSEAPLKETLAASVLVFAGWDLLAAEGGMLVDSMCGSGTLAIEGAMMAAGIAPGLLRERWGFEGWVRHDAQLWNELVAEAYAEQADSRPHVRIVAGDIDAAVVELARANAERAGVAGRVSFYVDDAANLARHVRGTRGMRGLLVANPPYGMRLLSQAELPAVHQALAAAVDAVPKGWQAAFITPDLGIDTALGRTPHEVIACYNGPIEAWVRHYDLSLGPQAHTVTTLSGRQVAVRMADEGSVQFAGRLRKVAKERARWARREGVSCYRLYDADLPDYPLSVDVYEGAGPDEGKTFAVVEERPRPRAVDVQRAGRHFADAVTITVATLDMANGDAVQKPWVTDGLYERVKDASGGERLATVSEAGCLFRTDLAGAVGKGLPLDQRLIREEAAELSRGGRFANLFAAGSAATVLAASIGARSTVTVDASKERIEWVGEALRLNGLAGKRNALACADVRSWLVREAKAHRTYDVILCSPPERLEGRGDARAWSLERDLSGLLVLLGKVLAPRGTLVLALPAHCELPSCDFVVEDVSERMVPHDFERARNHARCYLLTHPHGSA